MKTITEFSGFVLRDAIAKKAALLTEGKSEEEAQAAVNEILKLDESKAGFYKNVTDMTSSRIDRVKRVVVASRSSETEKVPETYAEREGNFYLVEYFPDPNSRNARPSNDDDRGYGRDRGGRGGPGRGGPGRGRDDRRPGGGGGYGGGDRDRNADRAPRPSPGGAFAERKPDAPRPLNADAGGVRPPRENRPPRKPRPQNANGAPGNNRQPRGPRGPKGAGELRLVLKGQTQTTLQGSGTGETPDATPSESSAPSA